MHKSIIILLISLLFFGCRPGVKKTEVDNFSGYWEISKVGFPNGDKKDFTVNQTVDYFELHEGNGFRRKVMPQLDGKFVYASQPERVSVIDSAGVVYFKYETAYRVWKEEVLAVSKTEFVVRNDADIQYHYKKFEPFSIK